MKITGPSEKLHVIGFILTVIILHINYDTIDTYRVFDFWSIRMNKQWVRLILNHYKKKLIPFLWFDHNIIFSTFQL